MLNMQIFEFQFNPKNKEDVVFDSFCYEPENVYEKRMGSLYMLGTLKHVLPQNVRFLDKLAKQIKEKYYKTVSVSPEKSLKDTLKKANEYLEKVAKLGDVSWLGNLSFSVIGIKNFDLNFTKTGDIKIYLIRKGQVVDTDQKLNFEDFEPYPLKVFGNIVSGKLADNDMVLVLSKSVSDIFFEEKILSDIARISMSSKLTEETKRIKDIFNNKQEKLSKSTGAALLIVLSKEAMPRQREMVTSKKNLKIFSIKKALSPITNLIKVPNIKIKKPNLKIPKIGSIKLNKTKVTAPKIQKPDISLPKITKRKIHIPKLAKFKLNIKLNKKLTLIVLLTMFLLIGYYIFQLQTKNRIEDYSLMLEEAKSNLSKAENYISLSGNTPGAIENANELLNESWQELSPILAESNSLPSDFMEEVNTVKESVVNHLYQLNEFTEITEPTIYFDFTSKDYTPYRMTSFNNSFYFVNPNSKNILVLNNNKEANIIPGSNNIDFVSPSENNLLFLSKPDHLLGLTNNNLQEIQTLAFPYSNYDFTDFNTYGNNLYLLDRNQSKIVKYSYSNNKWGSPTLWLDENQNNSYKSMAIDGSIWLLTDTNQIKRYYGGSLQQTIKLDIFPKVENISKIFTFTNIPYLYLLEPDQKRIIITDKNGKIIQQFKSESFDNLLSLSVNKEGREIYLLNGSKLYILQF